MLEVKANGISSSLEMALSVHMLLGMLTETYNSYISSKLLKTCPLAIRDKKSVPVHTKLSERNAQNERSNSQKTCGNNVQENPQYEQFEICSNT